MSRETKDLSLFEQMGGTYFEKDGLLYPNFSMEQEPEQITVGKYGLLWTSYMKETYQDRYRHHIRMGQLQSMAAEVNEEAYEMLDSISEKYLKKHKPVNPESTMEMWKLREQAKRIAEEEVYETVVYRFY
ncbi:MAG: TnpV protein [Clostridium sp.]|nr:TnpV protein [Clostridium sp.]